MVKKTIRLETLAGNAAKRKKRGQTPSSRSATVTDNHQNQRASFIKAHPKIFQLELYKSGTISKLN